MYTGYNEIEDFFKFLYEKPNHIVFESDHIIDRNSGKYPNDGLIYYTEDMRNLMETQAFRRMGKIFQLGNKFITDSNLKHSREDHSKGTYARTLELCMHLLENKNLKTIIKNKHYEKYIVAELIRALLHDIGHGPFSHTMETICNLPKGFHEDIGKRIINEDKELRSALNRIWPNLAELISEVEERNFLGLNSLFEGQLDVDRGDFLSRDSWALRLPDVNSDEITDLLQNVSIQKINVNGRIKLAPVFSCQCLPEIEKFLDARFTNYQKFYYSSSSKLLDHVYKEFSEELLRSNENCGIKTFLEHNYGRQPEEIDLDEYIRYNDIEFLKGIIGVYDDTTNEKLKNLARMCIPDLKNYYSLYYGLMAAEEDMDDEGNIRLSPENRKLLNRIAQLPEDSTLNLIKQRYEITQAKNKKDLEYKLKKLKKVINTDQDEKFDFKDYGIIYDVSKNSLYKNKNGEEIYVSDENGKIYTFDKHPKRTIPIKQFTNATIIVDKDKLKEKVRSEEKLNQVLNILKNRERSK